MPEVIPMALRQSIVSHYKRGERISLMQKEKEL